MSKIDDDKQHRIDAPTGVETTGHEWDGIRELNNPAPRWWLIVFYITIIWSVWYWVVYPAWPTPGGSTEGTYGWTQYKELAESQSEILARKSEYMKEFESKTLHEAMADPELYEFARAGGEIAFKNHCAACHGTGAAGGEGYPNLNDDVWLWGGSLDDIYHSIRVGIRSSHDDTRFSQMPAFGATGVLTAEQITAVTDHVLSLSNLAEDDAQGAELFAEHCASCHAADGTGDRSLGAPDLTDAIWQYGGDRKSVMTTISKARNSVMPQWGDKLDDATMRQLAIYVHSLGGGE